LEDTTFLQVMDVSKELGPETPWHISRFFPHYEMTDRPPTPIDTLRQAREIGLEEGLHYVYVGNIPNDSGQNTFCPECGRLLIQRHGYRIAENIIIGGSCPTCGTSIAGFWEEGRP
jgi:pyruvate formate lyase activating enzyme